MTNKKESDIQSEIRDYLTWRGWFCFKNHQSLGSYKGVADLYAIKDGRSIWIEVKTPKGKMSQHQQRFKEHIEAKGGEYMVATSIEDLQEVEK